MSDDYDNFVGKKAEIEKRGTLNEFLGEGDEEPWEKHWVGMPEFEQEDANWKKTGEKTKTVKYSILYMKAVKALQEAMVRIETLEAEVVKLKG